MSSGPLCSTKQEKMESCRHIQFCFLYFLGKSTPMPMLYQTLEGSSKVLHRLRSLPWSHAWCLILTINSVGLGVEIDQKENKLELKYRGANLTLYSTLVPWANHSSPHTVFFPYAMEVANLQASETKTLCFQMDRSNRAILKTATEYKHGPENATC